MALVLISISGISSLDTTSYSLKELLFPEEEIVEIEEPLELKQIDKKELVDNYILDLFQKALYSNRREECGNCCCLSR